MLLHLTGIPMLNHRNEYRTCTSSPPLCLALRLRGDI